MALGNITDRRLNLRESKLVAVSGCGEIVKVNGDIAADIDNELINDIKNDFSKGKDIEMNAEDEI